MYRNSFERNLILYRKGIFVGYTNPDFCKIWYSDSNMVYVARNVIFNKSKTISCRKPQ